MRTGDSSKEDKDLAAQAFDAAMAKLEVIVTDAK